jgi:sarcosine oxidase, subunit gamma
VTDTWWTRAWCAFHSWRQHEQCSTLVARIRHAAALRPQRTARGRTSPPAWLPRARAREHLIARLGHTEFFIETADVALDEFERSLAGEPGVYPVLRQDSAFVLGGEHACDALAEVCNVDFAALAPAARPVVMTLMAGVAILVLPQATDEGIIHRIWCDPSFGPYLWETLAEVVKTTTGRAA